MFGQSHPHAFVRLAALAAAVAAIAACNALGTEPHAKDANPHRSISPASANHDDSDSLVVCLGGYVIINGRAVCADP